ncbi:carbohydrate kinase family protein [Fontivita pretiosa]|uniref:carbohydrate kinase family protein n=1 Tax=Fontivita pretiosa TaxID=2989684 RepID=UPI003D16C634
MQTPSDREMAAAAKAFDVMVAGHLCLDIIPTFPENTARQIEQIFRPGKLVNVGPATLSTGGPVSNTGLNLKTLGNRVRFCARCGEDELGQITLGILRRSGNADGIQIARGMASSYTLVIAPPGIDRIFLHNPGTNNSFGPEDLNPALIGECRHFHFGYPPLMRRMYESAGQELQQVLRIAKDAGATTSLDMSLPDPSSPSGQVNWRAILQKVLPYVDLFLPSIEETLFFLRPDEFLKMKAQHQGAELIDFISAAQYSSLADECLAMGAKVVALKSGHRGFYVKTASQQKISTLRQSSPLDAANWANRELWAAAFVVDRLGSATGSGDSAIAGFLTAFLRGLNLERALRCATCLGLQNLRVMDAVSGAKSWEETSQMMDQPLPLIDPHLSGSGWKWNEHHQLWAGPADPLDGTTR